MDAVNILAFVTPGAGNVASASGFEGAKGEDFLQELSAVYSALISGEAEVSEEKISSDESSDTETPLEIPEEFADSETVIYYIMGLASKEAAPTRKDFLSFFDTAAQELSGAIDAKQQALLTEIGEMDTPTAEKYMKDLEEKLALVEELLKKLRQNEGSENSVDTAKQAAQQAASTAGASPVFESSKSGFMAVMPGKETLSVMAAKAMGENLSAGEEQPKNPNPEMLAEPETADITDADVDQFVRGEKAPQLPEKTAEKVAPPVVKENNVQQSEATVSARKLPVEEVRMEQGNNQENGNKDASGQGASQGGEFARATRGEKSEFTLNNNSSEQADDAAFDLKPARSEGAIETKAEDTRSTQAERILRWESVKDVAKLAKMVQQAGADGQTKLTVRLNPENLGRLEVQLTEINGRLEVKLMASSQESRALLATHADAIRQQLAERGIHIDSMDLAFHDSMERESAQYESKRNRFAGEKQAGEQDFVKEEEDGASSDKDVLYA